MSPLTAVAMSGGLDSSMVAWILSRGEGTVVGLSMLLWDRSGEATHGRCCGALDLRDARRVAEQCGIPHYTLRMEEDFRRHVVDPFVRDYLEGRTPNPCTRCNTWVKFDLFLDRARSLGAEGIATGHYARILEGDDGYELHQAADRGKDQSYYLFELNQDQLAVSNFPLGCLDKDEVRKLAREAGLVVSEKGESMEVCFVPGGIREFVEEQVGSHPERFGESGRSGPSEIYDREGRLLGEGQPYYRYTVGQRRGLGVSSSERLYVLGVEPDRNRVVVGGEGDLLSPGLVGERLHWIGSRPSSDMETTVKIRSRHAGVPARITALEGDRVRVDFSVPQPGVAPGQAAVFYQGTKVLGGCWIVEGIEN